jgi:anti-sigma regulatory factor (Ser/Thr protein kinase)
MTLGLPACGSSVSQARHRVRSFLAAHGCGEDTCDTAVLLVSELATNTVRHTASPAIICTVWLDTERVRIAVEDSGNVLAGLTFRESDCEEVNGRGLLLVSELSVKWGVSTGRDGTGQVVWADLSNTR